MEKSYEYAQDALDNIKDEFAQDGFRLEIVSEDKYEEVAELLLKHHIPHEPLACAFDVNLEGKVEKQFFYCSQSKMLGENKSVMIVSEENNKVVGASVMKTLKKTVPLFDANLIPDKGLRELVKFVRSAGGGTKFFDYFDGDEAMYLAILCIHKDYRQLGIGTKLVKVSEALAARLGFKLMKIEATSNYTRKICEKFNYETFREISYDEYFYNGAPLQEKTGPHTMMKIVGKKL